MDFSKTYRLIGAIILAWCSTLFPNNLSEVILGLNYTKIFWAIPNTKQSFVVEPTNEDGHPELKLVIIIMMLQDKEASS